MRWIPTIKWWRSETISHRGSSPSWGIGFYVGPYSLVITLIGREAGYSENG